MVGYAEIGASSEGRGLKRAWVACSNCQRRTPDFDTVGEAFAAWNQSQRTLALGQAEPDVAAPDQPGGDQPDSEKPSTPAS
jgi:hypothetical protein